MRVSFVTLSSLLFVLCGIAWGATIYVDVANNTGVENGSQTNPYNTIQEGIDAATDGDMVPVADGTYTGVGNKEIDFSGKAITVTSVNGPTNSVINCEQAGQGVVFHSGETAEATLEGFTVTNASVDWGGAVYCSGASPTIKKNIITTNAVYGVFCDGDAHPTVIDNVIENNSWSGVKIHNSSSPQVLRNTIRGNGLNDPFSDEQAGIVLNSLGNPSIVNNLILSNQSKGIWAFATIDSDNITNNTIRGNPIGIALGDANVTIRNSIVWGNGDGIVVEHGNPTIVVAYSNVQGGWAGESNINAQPLFVDGVNGDYHLQDNSPCIGAGTSNGAPTTDIEGTTRGTPPDIGAYENTRDTPLPVELSAFMAATDVDGIRLRWTTQSEENNLGFHVYRSTTENGEYIRVTNALISGQRTDSTPHDYTYLDENVQQEQTYWYSIEDKDFFGNTRRSHPIKVVFDPRSKLTDIFFVEIPLKSRLLPNYPNPFNPETWFPYELTEASDVTLRVFDAQGRLTRQFDLGHQPAGSYLDKLNAVYWDGRDDIGQRVASGVYFYTLRAGDFVATRQLVILSSSSNSVPLASSQPAGGNSRESSRHHACHSPDSCLNRSLHRVGLPG